MECIINCDEIKEKNIVFKLPIRNQNAKYSHFYKILYSSSKISMKYILLNISTIQYSIHEGPCKYKVVIEKSDKNVQSICKVEYMILKALNNSLNKNIILNLSKDIQEKPYLYSFLQYPVIKHLLLKISGVWENETSIGLVYKFTYITSTENLSNIID